MKGDYRIKRLLLIHDQYFQITKKGTVLNKNNKNLINEWILEIREICNYFIKYYPSHSCFYYDIAEEILYNSEKVKTNCKDISKLNSFFSDIKSYINYWKEHHDININFYDVYND